MTHLGYAVGRVDGQAIFVSYALPDEQVTVYVTREKAAFITGATQAVERAAEERVEPPCPLFHSAGCGGCQWQHILYEAQLRFKTAIVAEQLERIGRFTRPNVLPALASPSAFAYRTHATFTVDQRGGLAFVATDNTTLKPVNQCLLLRPELKEMLDRLATVDFSGTGRVRLQVGTEASDRAVIMYGSLQDQAALLAAVGNKVSVVEIHGGRLRPLQGSRYLTYSIAGRGFRASAGGFFQVNLLQAAQLVRLVEELLPPSGGHALDLYAGVGLLSAFLAPHSDRVTSIEEYAPAVEDARHNLADYPTVTVRKGKVEAVLPSVRRPVDVVVTDPPRAGMKADVVQRLIELVPTRIIYVSCEPSTLARDARLLAAGGYVLRSVQPVDMFPQTYHIESVACFDHL